MIPVAPYPASAEEHVRGASTAPRRIGKATYSNTRDGSGDSFAPALSSRSGLQDRRKTFQSGTTAYAPLWNEPALRPAFAAQALGQVMRDQRLDVVDMALLAYRHAIVQSPSAMRLDVRL